MRRHDHALVGDTRRNEGILESRRADVLLADGGVGEVRRVRREVRSVGKYDATTPGRSSGGTLVVAEGVRLCGQVLGAEGDAEKP